MPLNAWGDAIPDQKWSARAIRLPRRTRSTDPIVRERLRLQQGASGKLQRHLFRAVRRVIVLVGADLASFWVIRVCVRAVRDYHVMGSAFAHLVELVLPRGILSGFQYAAALLVALAVTGNYAEGDQRHDERRLFLACALATALPLWMTIWVWGIGTVLPQYTLTTALMWFALVAERVAIDRFVARVGPATRGVPAVFVGTAEACTAAMESPVFRLGREYRTLGFVDSRAPAAAPALGGVRDFARILQESGAEVVVVCGYLNDARFHDVVDASVAAGTQILSVPRAIKVAGVTPTMVWRQGQPLIELSRPALHSRQLFLKRTLDVVVSALGLLLLLPLFGVLALAVTLESRGAAIFGHRRLGRNGQKFHCYKFRSMHGDADVRLRSDAALYAEYLANDYKLPEARDPRLTKIGRWLRRTSLDELPQLVNVLRGEMSLVGPRPIVPEEIDEYGQGAPAFLSLKPGITGAWQINGRSHVGYPERADIELEYVRNWSLGRDLWILIKTIPAVLMQHGAH